MSDAPKDRFQLYGRRRGRPLRPNRQELLDSFMPRIALELPAGDEQVDPRSLFSKPIEQVWLEIGFGAGEHLIAQAEAYPDTGLIGCEPFLPGVSTLLSRVSPEPPSNLRILADDVRPLLWRLAPDTLSRVFILFPDPWPKARHHRRRIVAGPNLDRLIMLMRDDAELRIATDDRDYLRWILEATLDRPELTWQAAGPRDWRERVADWPPTRYERKAIRQGRQPYFLRFRRRARDRLTSL